MEEKLLSIEEKLQILINIIQTKDGETYKLVIYLIPLFGIVFGTTLLWSIFYWWHKQRVELIRSGLYKPTQFDLRAFYFFIGLLLTFIGLVLSIVFILVLGKTMTMLGGLLPLAIGLGLLTYYKLRT